MPRFAIDPGQSRVWIDARSSLHPVHSETSGAEGFVELGVSGGRVDPAAPARGRIELAVARLSSGNPLYDREMRRRVDARRFPTITGELRGVKPAGTGTCLVSGDVTFRGVTRAYEDEMGIALVDEETVRLTGSRVFDVREFGLEPPRILTLRVHPDVTVRVDIVARA